MVLTVSPGRSRETGRWALWAPGLPASRHGAAPAAPAPHPPAAAVAAGGAGGMMGVGDPGGAPRGFLVVALEHGHLAEAVPQLLQRHATGPQQRGRLRGHVEDGAFHADRRRPPGQDQLAAVLEGFTP